MDFSGDDLRYFKQCRNARAASEHGEQRLLHRRLSGDAAFLRATDDGYSTGRDPDPSGLLPTVYPPANYGRLPTQLPPVRKQK